jgi:hypothetical protein
MTSISKVDTRPVLVVVSAGNCGACQTWEKQKGFDQVRDKVLEDGHVRYEHIKVAKMGDAFDKKYPQKLSQFVRYYPTFILINGKDWNNALDGIDEKNPNIEVFNCRIVEGTVVPVSQNGPDKIPDWVATQCTTNAKINNVTIHKAPQISESQKSIEIVDTDSGKYLPTCGAVKFAQSNRR